MKEVKFLIFRFSNVTIFKEILQFIVQISA